MYQQQSPSPTNADASSPRRSTHSTSTTACTQQRSPSPTNADALHAEKHQLDKHHCIHQQQSPSPTNADVLPEEKHQLDE
jgi:hypothetical protein